MIYLEDDFDKEAKAEEKNGKEPEVLTKNQADIRGDFTEKV
jgi:hypothetical protein